MAKTKQIQRTQQKSRTISEKVSSFDLDELIGKYFWLIIPILVLLYYWFSTGSTGFYQDDEIGHYRNIRQFWGDPFSIMGNQPKPGWKILMVIPGLFGFTGVLLAHCLVAALTVFATFKLGKALHLKNSSIGAILLGVQPLYLQLAFRSYSEITAGLFMVLMLWLYYKDQYVLSALCSSYIFSIRQEFALVSIGLGVIFLLRKKWLPLVLLAWTPIALAVIGWLATGNVRWLLDDMTKIGLGVQVPHKPFWHYFGTYIFMVGPITLALFHIGYWKIFYPFDKIKDAVREHGFLFFTFTIMFAWAVFSAWDVPNFGANPGHWRYLLSIAPLTAVYAVKGMNALFDEKDKNIVTILFAVFVFIVFAFLSKETNGLTISETTAYDKFYFLFGFLLMYLVFAYAKIVNGQVLVGGALLLAVIYTFYAEKPRKLDVEAQTVKQAAAWYASQSPEIRKRPLLGNHVLFRYFSDIDINDKQRDIPLQKSTMEKAKVGSILIWDSHYGNSQFGGDVPMEYFQDNPKYKLLNQIVNPERTFGVLVFEKVQP
jgi:hypothetical protein